MVAPPGKLPVGMGEVTGPLTQLMVEPAVTLVKEIVAVLGPTQVTFVEVFVNVGFTILDIIVVIDVAEAH